MCSTCLFRSLILHFSYLSNINSILKSLQHQPCCVFNVLYDPTWKPKQMVGTTLNIDAQELILKNTEHTQTVTDAHKMRRMHASFKNQRDWPLAVLWSYYDCMALHQVIFDNHCHAKICSSQRPQHTDRRRKQLSRSKIYSQLEVILTTGKCCVPCVLLDTDFFWDGQW